MRYPLHNQLQHHHQQCFQAVPESLVLHQLSKHRTSQAVVNSLTDSAACLGDCHTTAALIGIPPRRWSAHPCWQVVVIQLVAQLLNLIRSQPCMINGIARTQRCHDPAKEFWVTVNKIRVVIVRAPHFTGKQGMKIGTHPSEEGVF